MIRMSLEGKKTMTIKQGVSFKKSMTLIETIRESQKDLESWELQIYTCLTILILKNVGTTMKKKKAIK